MVAGAADIGHGVDSCHILGRNVKIKHLGVFNNAFLMYRLGQRYYVSDSVYIMEHGSFVEWGPAEDVIIHPQAEYTKRLINDVPKIYGEWDLSTV